ncbi:MAG: TlpA family protein disulfide reductase [Bacteroidota bacterium]
MKTLKRSLLVLLAFCFVTTQAGQLKINLTPYKEIKDGFYAVGVNRHQTFFRYVDEYDQLVFSKDGTFEIDLPQGRYVLAMLHPSSSIVYYHTFIEDDDAVVELDVKMDQAAIPAAIDSVRIVGDFNNWYRPAPHLVFDEKRNHWYLPDGAVDKHIELYHLLINNDYRTHLVGKPTGELNTWCNIANKNDRKDNRIILDLDEYKPGEPEPVISGSGADTEYHALCEAFHDMTVTLRDSMYAVKDAADLNAYIALYQGKSKEFTELESNHATRYPWAFPEQKAQLLRYSPVEAKVRLAWNENNREKAKQIQSSEAYLENVKAKMSLVKDMRLNDLVINTGLGAILSNGRYDLQAYGLHDELDIPYGELQQIESAILDVSRNEDICASILLKKAQEMYYRPEKSKKLLLAIKSDYPNSVLVKNGTVEKYLKEYSMVAGIEAPDFKMVSLTGEEVCLSELKGKFVFLDFWGSWCGPCVQEIPNVKKLAEELAENDLVVLGIICHDTKEKAEKILAENQAVYANVMGDEAILASYGVAKFPTTFLIDREGKIVAKDIRGSNLAEQVKKMME